MQIIDGFTACLVCLVCLLFLSKVGCAVDWEKITSNPDCISALRSQGLPRRLHDRNGNLIIKPTASVIAVAEKLGVARNDPLLTCMDMESSQLAFHIRKEFIVPPSNEALNLSVPLEEFLEVPVEVPYEVDQLVFNESLKGGFFIEAGSNDGEDNSDSLHFEANHGWKGLLVEPNVFLFSELQEKKRHAYSINSCLSSEKRPAILKFNLETNALTGALMDGDDPVELLCLPLYSILLALGNPTVNYFSLDIEGGEFPVLKSIPWDKVDIQVLSVETHFAGEVFPGSREDIIDYMLSVGYQHIPWGHKNHRTVLYMNKLLTITNDMFVKEGIHVNTWEQVQQRKGPERA